VYQSQIPILMSGLNLTRQVLAKQEHIDEIRAINNPTTSVVANLLTFYLATSTRHSHDGAAMHDPCAVAAIIDPTLIEFVPMHVAVETAGTHTYGMTVCDDRPGSVKSKEANVEVAVKIDSDRFFKLLIDTLRTY